MKDNDQLTKLFNNLPSTQSKGTYLRKLLQSKKEIPRKFCQVAVDFLINEREFGDAARFMAKKGKLKKAIEIYRRGNLLLAGDFAKQLGFEDKAKELWNQYIWI